MLTIRFSRKGKKKNPFYRIIISEKHRDTQADYQELLGHYNPMNKETVLKKDRIQYWLGVGATMSNSVHNLLMREGLVKSDKKQKSVKISKKRQAKIDEQKKKDQPAEPVAKEAPAKESVSEPTAQPTEAPAAVETPTETAAE